MPFLMSGISMFCNSTLNNNVDACSKTLEAFSKQTQLYQYDVKAESYFTDYAKKLSYNYLGQDVTDTAVSSGYAYRIYREKAINFKLPTFGICDGASTHVTLNSYTLNLKWNFSW